LVIILSIIRYQRLAPERKDGSTIPRKALFVMLTREDNELLTRIGPDSRMGNLLRRYWWPIAAASEMEQLWTRRVRLLGEDLVLFKTRRGDFGLIAEECPHRRASLAYGIPTEDGIRCPYHGWRFDGTGACVEQPNEPADSAFKDKVRTSGYPVQDLGGLLFAYLGPSPAPLLPRLAPFVVEGAIRLVGQAIVPCNWLQIMENSLDPVHTEWLHGKLHEFLKEGSGEKVTISRHHVKIDFTEWEYGIYKHRLLEGQSEDADDWRIGHPIIFPYLLANGYSNPSWQNYAFQIRVPIDDENTLHLWYNAFVPPAEAVVPLHLRERIWTYDVPYRDEHGEFTLWNIDSQDIMAWTTQGRIADRSVERLGTTDVGVLMYRKMLLRELAVAEAGGDPKGVIRDSHKNQFIDIPMERDKHHYHDGFESLARRTRLAYAPILEELIHVFTPAKQPASA
jgi:5,5'-dehydrodivanillate O-demethylase